MSKKILSLVMKKRTNNMLSMPVFSAIAILVCSAQISANYGLASKRYISEFTLDDLNYQPTTFNHLGFKNAQQHLQASPSRLLSLSTQYGK